MNYVEGLAVTRFGSGRNWAIVHHGGGTVTDKIKTKKEAEAIAGYLRRGADWTVSERAIVSNPVYRHAAIAASAAAMLNRNCR